MPNTSSGKMHSDEVSITEAMVRGLLAEQFPKWAELPLAPVASAGTDHALYRLGTEFVVRLPRIHTAAGQGEKEYDWLPRLAPHMTLAVPVPLARGNPGAGYPFRWTVCRWLEGDTLSLEHHADSIDIAVTLAGFITTLHGLDATDGPPPGEHNFGRGVPLAQRDARTRAAIASLDGLIDTEAATAAWDTALAVPTWDQPPVWIHGDLQAGNLLVSEGRLSAVIDFGGMAVGDPACDMQVAWNLFTDESRAVFRRALHVDDATWARGRGWALSVAVIALPYYLKTNPRLVAISRRALDAVLAEHLREG